MNDDYLWDRSGAPDAEIERLERVLAPLRAGRPSLAAAAAQARPVRPQLRWLAAAAAVILAALALLRLPAPDAAASAWQVESLSGTARVGGRSASVDMAVRAGQTLRTGADSGLTMEANEVGSVDLGPDSELRASSANRLLLRRGTLHAFIWAPPRQFVVDTPAARAVDLGCEYTMTVNAAGEGLLRVQYGWVAFQYADRESFIPEGAQCVMRPRSGPGIPYYEDAPAALREGLSRLESGDEAALSEILAAARPRDGLTLWHLLTRAAPADRGRVFDRFAQLVKLPPEVTREGALKKQARALDLCWDALDLENTDWWRGWERRW
ncbi:MAG TPA: hypothetical protein VMU19_08695 [Bryobacteraceae bacterium]|nr:hypothetical protein [Bryobacteraceae bacterium]